MIIMYNPTAQQAEWTHVQEARAGISPQVVIFRRPRYAQSDPKQRC